MKPSSTAPKPIVAAFGKHPAWDDHFTHGLATDALLAFKRHIYDEGIKPLIDGGAWQVPDGDPYPYRHFVVWRYGNGVIVARMVASSDGKGRRRFPLVVAIDAPLPGAGLEPDRVQTFAGLLHNLEGQVVAASTTTEVQAAVDALGNSLQPMDHLAALKTDQTQQLGAPAAAFQHLASALADEALTRSVYALSREIEPAVQVPAPWTRHVRLAAARSADPVAGTAAAGHWALILGALYGASLHSCFVLEDNRPWVDMIVGTITADALTCLLADADRLPPAQDVPYEIALGFMAEVQNRLAQASAIDHNTPSLRDRLRGWFKS